MAPTFKIDVPDGYSVSVSVTQAGQTLSAAPLLPAPPAPTELSVTATSITVGLTPDQDVPEGVIARHVLWSIDDGEATEVVLGDAVLTYTITDLSPETVHYVSEAFENASGVGAYSPQAVITTAAASVAPPAQMAAPTLTQTGTTTLGVEYQTVADAELYQVMVSDIADFANAFGGAGPYVVEVAAPTTYVVLGSGTPANNVALNANDEYFIQVRAYNGAWGPFSPTASATTLAETTVPGAPTITQVEILSPTSLRVSWAAPANNGGAAISRYDLYWTQNGVETTAANVTSPHTITGMTTNVLASMEVTATNSVGEGPRSLPETETPTDQTAAPSAGPAPLVSATSQTAVNITPVGGQNPNGSAITRRDLRWSVNGGSTWTVVSGVTVGQAESVTSLSAGTTLLAQERAANSIGDGAWSASRSVTTSSGSASVSIEHYERDTGYAPAHFGFKANVSGFNTSDVRRLRFKWSFNDIHNTAPAAVFTDRYAELQSRLPALHAEFTDLNKAYGWMAGHTYAPRQADFNGAAQIAYDVQVEVTDGTNTATATTTVFVKNPVSDFDQIIAVTSAGGVSEFRSEFGTGHVEVNSIAAANAAMSGNKVAVYLRRGESFSGSFDSSNRTEFVVDAFGDPQNPRPIIDMSGVTSNGFTIDEDTREFCVGRVDCRGDWNVLTEKPGPSNNYTLLGMSTGNRFSSVLTYVSLYDVDFVNINKIGLYTLQQTENYTTHKTFWGCSRLRIYDVRDYGMLLNTADGFMFHGVSVCSDKMKLQGGPKGDNLHHEHSAVRISVPRAGKPIVFDAFEFDSFAGWSQQGSKVGTVRAAQEFRLNPGYTDGVTRELCDFIMTRFVGEGGSGGMGLTSRHGSNPPIGNILGLVDKGIHIAIPQSPTSFGSADSGVMFQNLLSIVPRCILTRTKTVDGQIRFSTANGGGARGNTVVNWVDPTGGNYGANNFAATGGTGSIEHIPNQASPVVASGVDFSRRLFDPRYPGIRFRDHQQWHGSDPNAIVSWPEYASQVSFQQNGQTQYSVVLPVPNAGQQTTSAANVPVDDIFGNIRSQTDGGTIYAGCVQRGSVT